MSKTFKSYGKIVDRQNANIPLIKKVKAKHLREEHKKDPSANIYLVPDEFSDVKNFANKQKTITKKKPEFFFDMKGDGKPLETKKQSRIDKARQPFTMRNGKKHYQKYHSL